MRIEYKRLKDCCTKIGSGATPKGGSSVYIDSGVSLIRSQNVYNLKFSYSGLAHINDEAANKLKGVIVNKGDVLLNITGDSVARTCVVPDEVLPARVNQHVSIIRPNKDVDSRYLNYYFASPAMQGYLLNIASTGASRNAITKGMIEKLVIPFPDMDSQRRIASILSAYDNLIENNNKRIRLLEQMAENLYKEWFVRFRFPGHEKAEFENGLPKGWKIDKFGKYADVKRGGSPRPIQDYLSEEGLNWLKISDVTSLSSPYVFQINEKIKKEGLKKTVYRKAGTLVLSNSATPGISKILCVDTCIHDGWLYFENSYFSNEFLNLFFQHERANILKFGNGAVFTNLKTDILKNYNMSIPPLKILDDFQEIIMPIYELLKVIVQKNQILTRERDLLLPRLMSGKLEVNV